MSEILSKLRKQLEDIKKQFNEIKEKRGILISESANLAQEMLRLQGEHRRLLSIIEDLETIETIGNKDGKLGDKD